MVQKETRLKVADNTGAKEILMICNLNSESKFANVGDSIVATVKKAIPTMTVKKGELVRAVIVRTKFPVHRKNGQTVFFDENAAVIIDKKGNPRGTRIFGPVAKELKQRGFSKIISLVKEVV